MNLLSITLLVVCSSFECLGKLWTYFLCFNMGSFENLSTIVCGCIVVTMQMPLFLDLIGILIQKVNPDALSRLMSDKVTELELKHEIEIKWHVWCMDYSRQVCTINAKVK